MKNKTNKTKQHQNSLRTNAHLRFYDAPGHPQPEELLQQPEHLR